MPPFVVFVAIAAGAALATRMIGREWRRVNRELDQIKPEADAASTLRRDPATGVWRPE
jgi:hypothetical protein